VLIGNCPDHGVFTVGGAGRTDLGQRRMHPEERLWLIDQALQRFLVDPDTEDFMVLQSSTLPCNYVQFRLNFDDLLGRGVLAPVGLPVLRQPPAFGGCRGEH